MQIATCLSVVPLFPVNLCTVNEHTHQSCTLDALQGFSPLLKICMTRHKEFPSFPSYVLIDMTAHQESLQFYLPFRYEHTVGVSILPSLSYIDDHTQGVSTDFPFLYHHTLGVSTYFPFSTWPHFRSLPSFPFLLCMTIYWESSPVSPSLPQLEKLVPQFPANVYGGNRPLKTLY
jgi:hypothetical protein